MAVSRNLPPLRIPPLDELCARFTAHAEGYLSGMDETDAFNIRLKIDHSLRVLDMARAITQGEDIDERHGQSDAQRTAHAAALFHDTGRFPQYARYKTFSDPKSENHARLGVLTLIRDGLLADFSPKARGLVLGTVALHNRLALPAGLDEPLRTPARVVRDADKLDIIPVLLEHLAKAEAPNPVVVLNVAPDPKAYTPAMLEAVLERSNADYSLMRYTNDFKLLVISWVYGLEYRTSARLMREQGHLKAMLDSLPQDPALERMRGQVLDDLDNLCRDGSV